MLSARLCFAQQVNEANNLSVIPLPESVVLNQQTFHINRSTVISMDNMLPVGNLVFFRHYIKTQIHQELKITTRPASNSINLQIDSTQVLQAEGYRLLVTNHAITLTGHDAAGVFYGLQTLIQLMQVRGSTISIKGCEIKDQPRFAYRGMHLDVSRHIFPPAAIKKWIDVLALYKINNFHWHLTDDQGWRIEIKKYPGLQKVSAYRRETLTGHKKELPHRFDGQHYGGYYTQQEAKEIVKYAAERHITVIPEIEMPGHATAALAAYPALGCTGGPYQTATFWGVFDDVYCAGNEETFNFLQNVLDEVIAIFPSKYIHIGGDECPKTRWKACPKCRQRIKDEHLKDEQQLQAYFIKRIENYLNHKNRQIIGWDEILEGGLSPGATVMSWTGEEGGIAAAKQHHQVIMTPEKYVYLDYYQSLDPNAPLAAGGYTPLSKIYNYDPVPAVLTAQESGYILGVQANVWSEYLPDVRRAEYMMFPRLLALAEIAWSPKDKRRYSYFLQRVRGNRSLLNKLNINYADIFDEITDTVTRGKNGMPLLYLKTSLPGAVIRYTLNGSAPVYNSTLYNAPVSIAKSGLVKAALFKGKSLQYPIYSKQFIIHKAIGKKVTLNQAPVANYNPGNVFTLVNGIAGSNRYNDKQWFGFNGTDLEATIDLDRIEAIKFIGMHILNYHWQKMWAPNLLIFSVSADGIAYRQVYQQSNFPVNGINMSGAKIPPIMARYIKIKAINKGVIPNGEYGAGGKALLLTDEFIVN